MPPFIERPGGDPVAFLEDLSQQDGPLIAMLVAEAALVLLCLGAWLLL